MSRPRADENRRSAPWSCVSSSTSRRRASSKDEYSALPPTKFVVHRDDALKPAMSRLQPWNVVPCIVVPLKFAPGRLQCMKRQSVKEEPEKLIWSIWQSSNVIYVQRTCIARPPRKSPLTILSWYDPPESVRRKRGRNSIR